MLRRFVVVFLFAAIAGAQTSKACRSDRVISTIVGAGLGAAAGAIPATIVHRHDQASSHRIVVGSIAVGGLAGFLASGRDRPCTARSDTVRSRATTAQAAQAADVVATRSEHAMRGSLTGMAIGGVLGVLGGTLYQTGCEGAPCNERATRVGLMLFSGAEGAVAGGLFGGLLGWAWPVRRP